jgi:hypothetical protein
LGTAFALTAVTAADTPNVVLIDADDLDCYGAKKVKSTHPADHGID